jgi:hypothetical protein
VVSFSIILRRPKSRLLKKVSGGISLFAPIVFAGKAQFVGKKAKTSMQRLYKISPLLLAVLFWIGGGVLYGIAWRSGFERDFHGWLEMYYNQPLGAVLNREGRAITSLYQITQLQLWGWTWLFGTHLLPWFLLLTGLHAAAATLVVTFCRRLYADFGWKNAGPIAFWGGLFFLIAPSHAEVVIWKACYHYPVAVLLCFGIWGLLRKALLEGKALPILWAVLLYALSTFTLELFYATLPLAALLVFCYRQQVPTGAVRKVVVVGLLPMLFLFVLHFGLYHALYGHYIPHAEGLVKAGLENPLPTLGRLWQYEFHLLLQGRYWPPEERGKMYSLLGSATGGTLALLLTVGGAVFLSGWALRNKRVAPLLWLSAGAGIGMFLILPIGVLEWGIYYNDRHLYFTGLFQWQLLAAGIFALPPIARKIFLVFGAGILGGLSFYTALQCRRSATVFWKTLETFPLKRATEPLLLLNVPANLKGIVVFQEGPQSQEFNSHLRIFLGDSVQAKLRTVAGYGMELKEEGVRVLVKARDEIYVTIVRPGPWFWNTTLGAAAHETDLYRMQPDEWTHQYHLFLKDTTTRAFYFHNLQWKEVDFAIRDREQE